MIYTRPADDADVDQGDIIDDCPIAVFESVPEVGALSTNLTSELRRVYVLTQTCDLAQGKTANVVVATILNAQHLIAIGSLKIAEIRGPIRAGRVFGWYFLPGSESLALAESIVDLRSLHTVRLDVLADLCLQGKRLAHLESLYREHLAQHFANTYSRIGLPMPYETE